MITREEIWKMTVQEFYNILYGPLRLQIPLDNNPDDDLAMVSMMTLDHGKCLDLGCGTGRNAHPLAYDGFDVLGIDISDVAINRFNRVSKDYKLKALGVVGDIRIIPLETDYQLVVSSRVLHEMSRDDGLTVIERMKAHTAIGGFLVLSTYGKGDLAQQPLRPGGHYYERSELVGHFEMNKWQVIVADEQIESMPNMSNIVLSLVLQRTK